MLEAASISVKPIQISFEEAFFWGHLAFFSYKFMQYHKAGHTYLRWVPAAGVGISSLSLLGYYTGYMFN